MKNVNILAIVLLLVGLGAGFFGGMQYDRATQQKNQRLQFGQTNGAVDNQTRRAGFGQNGNNRSVSGDIISSDNNGITVKLTDGSSKIVLVSGSTQINKTNPAAKSDLSVGQKVMVIGTVNSDGSVTAQNIQLNPQTRGGTPSATPK